MVIMRDCWFDVKPGDPAFNIMTNMCDYFVLGKQDGDDLWLEGRVIDGEFIFNGRLFGPDGQMGTVIDNFPRSQAPAGWVQRRKLLTAGYELVDPRGEVVFGYHVDQNGICFVDVNLYTKDGKLGAHAGQGGLVVQVRPAMIGRGGMVLD